MGQYVRHPSGHGIVWVEDGQTPEQAAQQRLGGANTTIDTGAMQGYNWMASPWTQQTGPGPATGPFAPIDTSNLEYWNQGGGFLRNTDRLSQGVRPPSAISTGIDPAERTTVQVDTGQNTGPIQPQVIRFDDGTGMQPTTPTTIQSSPELMQNMQEQDWNQMLAELGLDSGFPQIPQINLPENPLMAEQFDQDFLRNWGFMTGDQISQIGDIFSRGNWPTMQAALMDLQGVPQPGAERPGSFDALERMLSGQGFDDATLSKMRGRASDDIGREALSQRSSAKINAERAGLQDSGAGLALQGQIDRRAGDARTRANYDIDIANAMQGMENMRSAVPLELQRQTSGAAFANEMALQNAARLFAGMQQNVANQQQASGVNTSNQQSREMARAGSQAGLQSTLASQLGGGMIDRANTANQGNVANTINRNLNQAQLDRQRDMYNTGIGENRYGGALGFLNSLITGANPSPYAIGGANQSGGFQPNMIPANIWQNLQTQFGNMRR